MTYIDFLNNFWDRDVEHGFKDNEAAVYLYLLHLANRARWTSLIVPCADSHMMSKYGIGGRTLDTIRVRLTFANLIRFTPGNGRGNKAQYQLVPPVKVRHTAHLSANKGLSPDTPLQDGILIKGTRKVGPLAHLLPTEPVPGNSLEAPKIEDTITVPIGTVPDLKKKATKKAVQPGTEKKPKTPRKPPSKLYPILIDVYDQWVRKQTDGVGAYISPTEGRSMKLIMAKLRKAVNDRAGVDQVELTPEQEETNMIATWQLLLDNTESMTSKYLKGKTTLKDINSEFQNILIAVKNAIRAKAQSESGVPTPTDQNQGRGRGGTVGGLQGLKRE